MTYLKLLFYKVFHWEYWPMQAIYYPIFPVWLYYAIKARSFFFFNAANPSITNGGMAMESKKDIYDMIPSQYIPKTLLINKDSSIDHSIEAAINADIHFPFIVKPDIGLKALGVEKIENKNELESYINKISTNFLIQELIEYPNEIGIFYVRHPNEKIGRVTGIVSKEFLTVIGNGRDTIIHLIKQNPRSHFQLSSLKKKHGKLLDTVLEKNEPFVLVPFGSHTRGAKFIDDSGKLTEKIQEVIHSICVQLPEFHYGRLDIRHASFEALGQGKNFSIIEINGAGSEPTHIYDSKHSLFFAWKEIIKHWELLYQISAVNNKKGHNYLSFKDGTAMLKANSILEEHLKLI